MKVVKGISIIICFVILSGNVVAQNKKKQEKFEIKDTKVVETTSVKSQDHSGTCWSYSTTSFIETELIRKGKGKYDLSEMFFVRNAYSNKAKNYVMRHGNANFSEGGQAHDVMKVVDEYGVITEDQYIGKNYGEEIHKHGEMSSVLKGMLDAVVKNKNKRLSTAWYNAFVAVLDVYLGVVPQNFFVNEINYDSKTFAKELDINANDYIELTSYNHHPFYSQFNIEIPDNWDGELYYNLPLDDFMKVIDNAFENGYSICWDGDVSEKSFSFKNGVAIVPEKEWKDRSSDEKDNFCKYIEKEKVIDQETRQVVFENQTSTDDHLMHLTGIAEDQNGNVYYKTKNSWGETSNSYGGYLYMSESYIRLNSVAIMIHKDALPDGIKNKLKL